MRNFALIGSLLLLLTRNSAAQEMVNGAHISDSTKVSETLYGILFQDIEQTAKQESRTRRLITATWVAQERVRLSNPRGANSVRARIALQLQRDSVLRTLVSSQRGRTLFTKRAEEMLPRMP